MVGESEHRANHQTGTERLIAFSDGVFAVAITLLIFNVAVPVVKQNLSGALWKQWPAYLGYGLSFVILGVIWAQHHHLFTLITRSDHTFHLINVVFLMWLAFIPFPTALLARYLENSSERGVAMAVYAGTFFVGAILFNLLWRYAASDGRLLGTDVDRRAVTKVTRSYNAGPALYFIDLVLAFFSGTASFILFLILAVFYALSPLPNQNSANE